VLFMSTRLPFRIPRRLIIYEFGFSYISIISYYISGEMIHLNLSIMVFVVGCPLLFIAEPKLSKRVSIALVAIGLCLYAPAPYLVLQGYIRFNLLQFLRDLALVVIAALTLTFISLIYGFIRYYKKSLVTETQRT